MFIFLISACRALSTCCFPEFSERNREDCSCQELFEEGARRSESDLSGLSVQLVVQLAVQLAVQLTVQPGYRAVVCGFVLLCGLRLCAEANQVRSEVRTLEAIFVASPRVGPLL